MISVYLVDPDQAYAERLIPRFEAIPDTRIRLHYCGTAEELKKHSDTAPPSCVLYSQALDERELRQAVSTKTHAFFFAWDDASLGLKYLPVSTFYHRLLHLLSEHIQIPSPSVHPGKLMVFTSYDGGVGVSTLVRAVATALLDTRKSRDVLFLDLDPFRRDLFPAVSEPSEDAYTLSDLVIAMRLPGMDAALRLDACLLIQQKIHYLLMPSRPEDFYQVRSDEWKNVFDLLKSKDMDILVDCSRDMLFHIPALVSSADRMLVMSRRSECDPVRLSQSVGYEWNSKVDRLVVRENEASGMDAGRLSHQSGICVAGKQDLQQIIHTPLVQGVVSWIAG